MFPCPKINLLSKGSNYFKIQIVNQIVYKYIYTLTYKVYKTEATT